LLTRFPIRERLDYYQADQLQEIVTRSARLLNVEIEEKGAREIARRSRGTPRMRTTFSDVVRDYAQVRHQGRITAEVATSPCDASRLTKTASTKWISASLKP